MTLTITPIYAGLLALLFVALSARVIARRGAARVSLGDGDDRELTKRIRVQANCAEYAPLGIVLLALTEIQGAPAGVVHMLGAALFVGRVWHAFGLGMTPQSPRLRVAGMILTLTMLGVAAIANIAHALF